MTKSDASTDQESSYVQMVYKYVRHTKDISILHAPTSSLNDAVNRTLLERMDMMLAYIGNSTGRTAQQYGLVWGSTRVDWGDVQNCQNPCNQQLDQRATISIGVYENAMYIIALKNLAEMANMTVTSYAPRTDWRAKAAQVSADTMKWLWQDPKVSGRAQFKPHLYPNVTVCGPAHGATSFECFPPRGSPFLHIRGFDENRIYYHGGTAVAVEAGLLSDGQVAAALQAMREDVAKAGGKITIGLTIYPPYPPAAFEAEHPYNYQNGGDWTWFGGRMVQNLLRLGVARGSQQMIAEAKAELRPMIDRVCDNKDFREWYGKNNNPSGSTTFHGSAGVLATAIKMLAAIERNS